MPARITLVTCGIIWKGSKFLIAQRKPDSLLEALKWEFPGGKIEFTEDPPQALRREIREELDFDIDVGDIFCVSSHQYQSATAPSRHILLLAYNCTYRGGTPRARDVNDFRWIGVENLSRYEFAGADQVIVARIKAERGSPSFEENRTVSEEVVLHDDRCTLKELKEEINNFVAERDWEQFHSPKNLSMSISIEAAELMEHFQWSTVRESRFLITDPKKFEEVGQEIADIAAYILSLCNIIGLDLSEAVTRKLKLNRRKYPLEKYWGKY
jgi:mutator protein MutT